MSIRTWDENLLKENLAELSHLDEGLLEATAFDEDFINENLSSLESLESEGTEDLKSFENKEIETKGICQK